MTIKCAWCGRVLHKGGPVETGDVCAACLARLRAELDEVKGSGAAQTPPGD